MDYETGKFVGVVQSFGPFKQPREGHPDMKKFHITFQIEDERPTDKGVEFGENHGKFITFDSFLDSEGSKKRIMEGLKACGYVVPPEPANPSPMLQTAKIVGQKAEITIIKNGRGYYEVQYVDPIGRKNAGSGPKPKTQLSQEETEDFLEAFGAFARQSGASEPENAPTGRIAPRQAPAAAPARTAAAPATRPAAAPSKPAAPQRQPRRENPDLGDAPMGGDDEIPF